MFNIIEMNIIACFEMSWYLVEFILYLYEAKVMWWKVIMACRLLCLGLCCLSYLAIHDSPYQKENFFTDYISPKFSSHISDVIISITILSFTFPLPFILISNFLFLVIFNSLFIFHFIFKFTFLFIITSIFLFLFTSQSSFPFPSLFPFSLLSLFAWIV